MAPLAVAKAVKVEIASAPILVVTLGPIGEMHSWPIPGRERAFVDSVDQPVVHRVSPAPCLTYPLLSYRARFDIQDRSFSMQPQSVLASGGSPAVASVQAAAGRSTAALGGGHSE